MAFLWADGFDMYSAVADVAQRWDSALTSGITIVATANTAFSVGQAMQLGNASPTIPILTRTFASNETTIFGSIRLKRGAGSLSTNYTWITFFDGSTAQVSIRWNEDGSISFMSGAANGTSLGATAAGVGAGATWDSWQWKFVISPTVGTFELRKNGSSVATLSLTGLNTRPGANTYVNKMVVGSNISLNSQIDDLFICSGSGAVPNDWPGDQRCVVQTPNATTQTQLSQNPTATTWGQTSNSTTIGTGLGSGQIGWFKITAPYSGTASTIAMSLSVSITGSLNAALYTDSAGVVGNLMSQGTTVVNPASGAQVFTLAAPQAIVKGTSYWVANWCSVAASNSFNGSSGSQTRMTQTLAYTGTFPSTGTAAGSLVTSAAAPYFGISLGSIDSASLVADTTQDADTSYVYGSTVGNYDLYSFPTLASLGITPAAITGVIPFAISKKSDSGARTISVQVKSGATEVAAVTNTGPSLSYSFLGGWLSTDPNTSATWTTAALDAVTVGPKVVA